MITGKPFLTETQIKERVSELAGQITVDYEGKDIIVVGILKGSFMFLTDLVKQLQIPVEIDFIVASSYIKTESTGEVVIHADVREDIKDRHVLIVEDIVDTGLTLKFIKDTLLERGPASLNICAFLDKKEHRKVDLDIDYVGFEIPDHFVVGYGLDYENKFRNLPYIAIFKKESG